MSVWLDYFITGLETQMIEIRGRGEQVIHRDMLENQHRRRSMLELVTESVSMRRKLSRLDVD